MFEKGHKMSEGIIILTFFDHSSIVKTWYRYCT